VTILELIQKTATYFEKSEVPNPRLDVELLLAHVLNLRRMDLYLQFERALTEKELDQLRPLVKRRASREPLQHIIGNVEFYGLPIQVSAKALIPRPETELLIERAKGFLANVQNDICILDMGTGTGAIALALAQVLPIAKVVATDISQEALSLASENAQKTNLSTRVEFRHGNLFEPIRENETFDLIVSNPPYIPTAEIASLQKEVLFDPICALDGGPDGLDIIRKIISDASRFLKSSGFLLLEIGINQMEPIRELFVKEGYTNIEFFKDLQQVYRIAKAQKST
jgi:release factor glutamine methyltransferase